MQDQIIQLLKQYGIINQLEQAHFLGQCAVESADFSKLTESPNYRYSTALKVFPKYKAQIQALQKKYNKGADDFVAQPDFFNLVYGARMGNQLNGTNDNDGWDYRGGGLLQLTGKANYQAFLMWLHGRGQYANLTIDTIDDFVRTPIGATISAIWFWLANGVGVYGDRGCTLEGRSAGEHKHSRERCVAADREPVADTDAAADHERARAGSRGDGPVGDTVRPLV
jgi:putative chitinase